MGFEQGESAFTSPPILSRLYQVISDGCLWFSHASKIAITPFPFPYHNLISIFLWIYTLLVPVLVNGTLMDVGLRILVSSCCLLLPCAECCRRQSRGPLSS